MSERSTIRDTFRRQPPRPVDKIGKRHRMRGVRIETPHEPRTAQPPEARVPSNQLPKIVEGRLRGRTKPAIPLRGHFDVLLKRSQSDDPQKDLKEMVRWKENLTDTREFLIGVGSIPGSGVLVLASLTAIEACETSLGLVLDPRVTTASIIVLGGVYMVVTHFVLRNNRADMQRFQIEIDQEIDFPGSSDPERVLSDLISNDSTRRSAARVLLSTEAFEKNLNAHRMAKTDSGLQDRLHELVTRMIAVVRSDKEPEDKRINALLGLAAMYWMFGGWIPEKKEVKALWRELEDLRGPVDEGFAKTAQQFVKLCRAVDGRD